jgi:hypothetical protein
VEFPSGEEKTVQEPKSRSILRFDVRAEARAYPKATFSAACLARAYP